MNEVIVPRRTLRRGIELGFFEGRPLFYDGTELVAIDAQAGKVKLTRFLGVNLVSPRTAHLSNIITDVKDGELAWLSWKTLERQGYRVRFLNPGRLYGYDSDIRKWLDANLLAEIAELEQKQAKGRASKAAIERAQSIESKTRRREGLREIARFIYSPTADNRPHDSLNHSEVIAMTVAFLNAKPGLRRLLIARYPILLIDESQDTASRLMDALLDVQAVFPAQFCLELFGDTMQRIFADGKVGLAEAIPEDWARPRKAMNHRCPKRVIALINKIRAEDDKQEQQPRSDAPEGTVRLFLAPDPPALPELPIPEGLRGHRPRCR